MSAHEFIFAGEPALLYSWTDVQPGGAPYLVFDWVNLGRPMTAIEFVIVNKGGVDVVATPEASPDGTYIASVGLAAPEALTITAGTTGADPYGVDLIIPYWRLWLDGNTTCDVYVYGIPRSRMLWPPT